MPLENRNMQMQEMQVYMGFPTVPYGNVSDDALGHLAVTEHAKERLLNELLCLHKAFTSWSNMI